MQSIREILRALLMGPRYVRYWQSLRQEELKRYGYGAAVKQQGRSKRQGDTNGRA